MKRFQATWRIGSLLLLTGVTLLLWRSREFFKPTRRESTSFVSVLQPGASRWYSLLRASSSVNFERLSTVALTAHVTARLREWEDDDEPSRRAAHIEELETLLTRSDKLEVIAALPPELMNFAWGLPSFQQWMRAEPQAAADWMSVHPAISEARLLTLLQNWKEENPAAMRVYLDALPSTAWRQKALAAAGNLAVSTDPVAAIGWASQMNSDERRTGLLELATVNWAKRDPAAATQWVNQTRFDSAVQEHLTGSLAMGYAEIDPVLAAQWAIRTLPSGPVLDRTVADIAGAWANYEPTAVAEWIARFPEGTARQLALGNLVNVWGNRDRPSVAAWVQAQPDVYLQSQATEVLAALPEKSVLPKD